MLQFLIKLPLIKFHSNSFLQLLNTTLSLLVIICWPLHSSRAAFVFSSLHSFVYSFIRTGRAESRSFSTHSFRVTDHISKLWPRSFLRDTGCELHRTVPFDLMRKAIFSPPFHSWLVHILSPFSRQPTFEMAQKRFSKEGFQPLPEDGNTPMANPNDATINIPLTKVNSQGQTGARKI